MTLDPNQSPEHPEIQNTPSSMHDWPQESPKKIHKGRLLALIILLAVLLGYYFFVLIPKERILDDEFHESRINSIEAELSNLEQENQ